MAFDPSERPTQKLGRFDVFVTNGHGPTGGIGLVTTKYAKDTKGRAGGLGENGLDGPRSIARFVKGPKSSRIPLRAEAVGGSDEILADFGMGIGGLASTGMDFFLESVL
jgi:hypothetical protein